MQNIPHSSTNQNVEASPGDIESLRAHFRQHLRPPADPMLLAKMARIGAAFFGTGGILIISGLSLNSSIWASGISFTMLGGFLCLMTKVNLDFEEQSVREEFYKQLFKCR